MPGKYLSSIISGNSSLLTTLLAFLTLNLVLTIPSWFAWYQQLHVAHSRLNWSVFAVFWVSIDLLLLTLLLFLTRSFSFHSRIFSFCIGLYLLLWLYEIYSKLILVLAHRKPLLYNDVFLINVGIYLFADLLKTYWLPLLALVGLFALFAVWIIPALFRYLDEGLQRLPANLSGFWVGLSVLAGIVLLHQVKHTRLPDAPTQIISGRIRYNLQRSAALYKQIHAPEFLARFRENIQRDLPYLTEKPDVYFFLVESYGAIIETHPRLRTAYRSILREFQNTVVPAGWQMVTHFSEAPVSGSGSWLSTASLLSGFRIANQATYDYLTASFTPPFVRFFRDNGYYSIILEPSSRSRPGLPLYNQYRFDMVLSLKDLAFDGLPRFGWGLIPDQYSLFMAESRWLRSITGPVFLYFPMVSSHAPWTPATIPPFLSKAESHHDFLRAYQTETVCKVSNGQKSGRYQTPNFLEMYLESTRYEFQVIADFLRRHSPDTSLVVIMGDHQPPLITSDQDSYKTPVHVLSGNNTNLQPFRDAGFISGMERDVPSNGISHHTFMNILIEALSHDDEVTHAQKTILP